jgi:hypothetical protein
VYTHIYTYIYVYIYIYIYIYIHKYSYVYVDILVEAANHSLKAVELANTLRARVGTEVLAHIRERWGGLLSLLERHPHKFRVERIPKNDLVTLVTTGAMPTHAPGGVQVNYIYLCTYSFMYIYVYSANNLARICMHICVYSCI